MTIQITKPALYAAAMRFAAKSEARPYLEAVAVQPRDGGGVTIISTDGHRMFVGIDENATWHGKPAHDCLFAVQKHKMPVAAFNANCLLLDGTTATFCGGVDEQAKPLLINHIEQAESIGHSQTFPDWTRVLPDPKADTVPLDAYSFNADYIADFGDVQKRLNGRKAMPFVARATGGDPALVSLGRDDCFGVLMPMRIGAAYDTGHGPALDALRSVAPNKFIETKEGRSMNKRQRQCIRAREIRTRDVVNKASRRERDFLMTLQDRICKESGFDTVGYHCALGHYWEELAYFLRDRESA